MVLDHADLAPGRFLFLEYFLDSEFNIFIGWGENLHRVGVDNLVLEHKRFGILSGNSGNLHLLVAEIVLDGESSIGTQLVGTLEFLRLFRRGGGAARVGETLVDILDERNFVVKGLEVDASVSRQYSGYSAFLYVHNFNAPIVYPSCLNYFFCIFGHTRIVFPPAQM